MSNSESSQTHCSFPEAVYVWWQQLNYFRLALRKLNRLTVKVKTHVLVPYDALTMCRALNRDFCPKHASIFSRESIHLIWGFLLLGKHCSDSVPELKVAQRHAYFLGLVKPGLAWDAGSWSAKPEADWIYLTPFQAMAKTWSPGKWVAMFLLTMWGHSCNPAAS